MNAIQYPVASFTDAWIETKSWRHCEKTLTSHLLQMRGLKPHLSLDRKHHRHKVASFTDAWIETSSQKTEIEPSLVASFTDAWIETCCAF